MYVFDPYYPKSLLNLWVRLWLSTDRSVRNRTRLVGIVLLSYHLIFLTKQTGVWGQTVVKFITQTIKSL